MLIGTSRHLAFKLSLVLFGMVYYPTVHAELLIESAWVKLAPPGAKVNAAYLQISNPGGEDVIIESLSASCCEELMLHRTRYENDSVVMEHVDQLIVPAGEQITLEPGGLHIMLLGAKKPLVLNDTVELTIFFADGQQQIFHVPVKK